MQILDSHASADIDHFISNSRLVRHPSLASVPGWDANDTSDDQRLPWLMADLLRYQHPDHPHDLIAGEGKSIGVRFLRSGNYRLLNLANIVQGWIFKLKFRIADGGKIERSEGKVQDYLNMICIYLFLRKKGKWATLPRPKEECLAAVRKYYLEGDDWEPNSQWIVDLYQKALKP